MLAVFLILALILPTLSVASEETTIPTTIQATVPSNAGPSTGDTISPSIPILVRPHDGTYTSQPHPEFVWMASVDQNSNFVSYHLYLNHIATFLGVNNYGNSLTHNYTARLEDGSIRLLPNTALPDGIYDWYVVAYDAAGNTSQSATWHLTIDTTPPALELVGLGKHNHPSISGSTILTIDNPAPTSIIIGSDPWASITLILVHSTLGTTFNQTIGAGLGGQAVFSHDLVLGDYLVYVAASDLAGNTSSLPVFTLRVGSTTTTPAISTPSERTPSPTYPDFSQLTSLPATILLSATKLKSADSILYMIAVGIILLLLTRVRKNLQIIDQATNQPIVNASVQIDSKQATTTDKHGKCYIRALAPHSMLTISYQDSLKVDMVTELCLLNLGDPITQLTL